MKFEMKPSGFTLVELTIVMVIVALLLGGLLLPLSAQQDIRLQSEAEKQLAEIRDALIGYAQINRRLPCPTTNPAGAGQEACPNDSGFVPWGDLGVRKTDPWGRMIRYRVSTAFRNNPANITSTTVANLGIQTRQQDTTLVNLTNANSVVFVLLSHGKNGFGGRDGDNNLINKPAGLNNLDEETNSGMETTFVSRSPSHASAPVIGEFDDVVVWVPTTLLINRLVAAGNPVAP